jgi:putative tryptophan/tyrosine transport system substrate-binding protein
VPSSLASEEFSPCRWSEGHSRQRKYFESGFWGAARRAAPNPQGSWAAFFAGLRDHGHVEGRNIVIEGRYYGDAIERLPALAAELVRMPVDVIVVGAVPAPEIAKRATSTIPIVLTNHSDPVGSGLVKSLAKPAGNITGVSVTNVGSKRLQLLKEAIPNLTHVVVLVDSTGEFHLSELELVARSLGVQLEVVEVRAPSEFAEAFSTATRKRAGALIVFGGIVSFRHRARLVELATATRLPAMYPTREYVDAGGLMVYAPDLRESYHRAARYVDGILKGTKPGDLPIELSTKTAKALGLTIPQSLLLRADQVIE